MESYLCKSQLQDIDCWVWKAQAPAWGWFQEPHRRVGNNYKKKLLLKKDLHALIDERIAFNKNKGFTFATLKDAKKYLEKH